MSANSRFLFPSIFVWLITLGFVVLAYFYVKNHYINPKPVFTEDVMVQKITSMGKLELVKYSMKDVIEKRQPHTLLPDERVLFVAVGEVAACIDLTKV